MAGHSIRINIDGAKFSVRTEESMDYVNSLADEINNMIQKVKSENPGLSASIVNALVMMELCDRVHKAESKVSNKKKQQ